MPADSFARVVAFAISQPDELDINEILFRPTSQELQDAPCTGWRRDRRFAVTLAAAARRSRRTRR